MPCTRRTFLMTTGASAVALLSGTAWSQRADAEVAIELIVFRHSGANDALGTARAAPEPAGPATTPPQARMLPLPPARQQLAGVEATLRRSGLGRVVARTGWSQVVPAGGSLPIRIEELPGIPAGLRGVVALERGQFLTLRLDLVLAAQGGGFLNLRERRRVKYGERHYFDHPVLGAIALVSPVKPDA